MWPRLKLLLAAAAVVAAALVGRVVLGDRFSPTALVASLRAVGDSAVAIPLFFLLFGVATSLFAPAVAMMVAAGVIWGFWPGWIVAWGAANVWANAHFLVGRWLAQDTVQRWLQRRGATRLVTELREGGVFTTIVVRQLPLPYALVNLAAGASPMQWSRWALGNTVGLLPNCLIYASLAAALADGAAGARQEAALKALMAAVGVIGLAGGMRWWRARTRSAAKGA